MLIILSTSHIRRVECHLTWRQMSHSLTLLPYLWQAQQSPLGVLETAGAKAIPSLWPPGHLGGPSMHTSPRSTEVGLAWNLEPSSNALAPPLASFLPFPPSALSQSDSCKKSPVPGTGHEG